MDVDESAADATELPTDVDRPAARQGHVANNFDKDGESHMDTSPQVYNRNIDDTSTNRNTAANITGHDTGNCDKDTHLYIRPGTSQRYTIAPPTAPNPESDEDIYILLTNITSQQIRQHLSARNKFANIYSNNYC
jgi:hypothetical protein